MRVNSINNFSYSHSNTVEKPVPAPQEPNFGRFILKGKALAAAKEGMQNLIDLKVESENVSSAEKAIRKWYKMLSEAWSLKIERHSHLPKFVEQFDDTPIGKIYRDSIPAYNEKLATLGKEADDLSVEVLDRVVTKDNRVAYTVNIPAYNVKEKVFLVAPKETSKEFSMCGVPTEQEVKLLKKGIYEQVVGEGFATTKNPGYDISGKLTKLFELMTEA